MLRLSDRVLAALPRFAEAPMAPAMAEIIGADLAGVRAAYVELEASGRAKIVRRGNGLHLVPADHPGRICAVCRAEYDPLPSRGEGGRLRPSKRRTCSRACAIKLGWQESPNREARVAAMVASRNTPESRAKSTAVNLRRWSDPAQREKLSRQNRERWADPVMKMKMSVAIQREHSTPEKRALYSRNIKARWDDPEGRRKIQEGTKRGKNTPEAKAKFRKLMQDRWADPVMREKYTAANRKRNEARAAAVRGRKQSPETIAKRVASRKRTMRER